MKCFWSVEIAYLARLELDFFGSVNFLNKRVSSSSGRILKFRKSPKKEKEMYTSSYAKPYKPGGVGSGGSSLLTDRPSTLPLSGGSGSSQTPGAGSSQGASSSNSTQPNKPSRYTPVYPTLMTGAGGQGGGKTGSGLGSTSPFAPYTRSAQIQAQSGGQGQSQGQAQGQGQGQAGKVEPPKQGQGYQQYLNFQRYQQPSPLPTNLAGTGSKSAQNLVESDNVFCLSCPPAEYKFSDAYRAKTLPRAGKENERLIGFATLPEQVHRKSVKKGFDFTLMVVGESGLGKSTLINSLFLADFYKERKMPGVADLVKKTTSIEKHTIEIEERGIKLRLTVVDTPGFGDSINCEESWKACVNHIDDQFHQYFQAESGLNRKHIQDGRVHCCLYFIPSYGRGLRQLDIEALKQLQNRVNVIPVISKADTLTPSEVRALKDKVLEDLRVNHIQMYQFPDCDEDEDEDFKRQDRELKAAIPFAVASSDTFVEIGGKRLRGRVYPWGIVEVENPNHSDFAKLRTMLIQSHMHDLKETTQDLHYENFRAKAIAQIAQNPRERSKLKRDSSTDNTHDMLMQKEAEIKRMQQMISKMEAKLKAAGHQSRGESIDI